MTRTMQFTVGLLSSASLLALGAAGASADHFDKLGRKHTNYGVAQYNVTNVSRSRRVGLTLMNPIHVTQLAAILMYQRPTRNRTTFCPAAAAPCTAAEFEAYLPEVFLGCLVVEMTPHSAVSLHDSTSTTWLDTSFTDAGAAWPGLPGTNRNSGINGMPRVAEVIWGPAEKVKVAGVRGLKRKADGLGGTTAGGHRTARSHTNLLHPGLFSLPSNDVVAGQREDAIECVCEGLADLFADRNTFEKFGISCP